MLRIVRQLGLPLCLLIVTVSARVRAQEAVSAEQLAAGNELLEAGKRAYADNRLSEALYDFQQAYERTRRPSILYRIADTADKLGDHERAIDAYQEYLDAFPTSSDRAFIEGRITANRQALEAPGQTGALTPEAAAHAAPPAAFSPSQVATASRSAGTPLFKTWWVWAGAGVVVVAGVVVAALLVGESSTHKSGPVTGNVGGVVETLRAP